METKAVIYARYSSEKQTEQSIEGQVHVCSEYAKRNNIEIIETYIDRAKSGRNDNREAFQKMLNDSANKKFEIVLVYALDRFSRNRFDSAINKALLKKNGVKLISATQPITDNPEGILLESLLEGLAEYYSAELAQKLTRGRRESIEKGQYVGGSVTYGYRIENKRYIIDPEEAQNVKLIFNLYKQGHSYTDILNFLKENLVLNRNKDYFKKHQIKNILENEAYTGVLKSGNFKNDNGMPIIIDKHIFMEVQNLMKSSYKRHSNANDNFLLTGKIICGECGANIVGDSGTSKTKKTYYYYACNNKKNNGSCDLERYPKTPLEDFVVNTIKENIDSQFIDEIIKDIHHVIDESDIKKDVANLKHELISIEKKLSNIAVAVSNGIISEEIKSQNQEFLNKKLDIENKIQEYENYSLINITDDVIKKYLEKFFKADKETIINVLLNKVIVYKDHIEIIINTTDDGNKTIKKDINLRDFNKKVRAKAPLVYQYILTASICSFFMQFFDLRNRTPGFVRVP